MLPPVTSSALGPTPMTPPPTPQPSWRSPGTVSRLRPAFYRQDEGNALFPRLTGGRLLTKPPQSFYLLRNLCLHYLEQHQRLLFI